MSNFMIPMMSLPMALAYSAIAGVQLRNAYANSVGTARAAVHNAVATDDLAMWLKSSAGVSDKFMPKVLAVCEEEMVGSVENLMMLKEAGLLSQVFKPVIAAGIETALLDGGSAVVAASSASASSPASASLDDPQLSLAEVKLRLMRNGQYTWGSEGELRGRLTFFDTQDALRVGAFWDSTACKWAMPQPAVPEAVTASALVSATPVVTATPEPAAAKVTSDPPPAKVAPAAVVDKDTFTVTLVTPEGELKFECPPDTFLLDQTDEEEADGFEELPYACRAGSCSACAGKVISGTVDASAGSFLSEDQLAAGFVLTCTTKPTSDCVIQTHAEEELFEDTGAFTETLSRRVVFFGGFFAEVMMQQRAKHLSESEEFLRPYTSWLSLAGSCGPTVVAKSALPSPPPPPSPSPS
eukprot:CAMPEP_0119308538 /NCGR_PEP_ID=MMETSP1333-20130426/11524_1 /TAXON_ID=418940 /ORGANISM="Scyphosphaera apsteinii, Strain RCC1455" /LENGTH=410 /DNA_ID=CAMNT_0007312335 /DNA_START=26 /DNA_END=1255 /DNA_ORIENTATION=-